MKRKTATERFEAIKQGYIDNFKRVNNRNTVDATYKNGFVTIYSEGQLSANRYRLPAFEKMAEVLASRPDYVAPKLKVKKVFQGEINTNNTDIEDRGQALITTIDSDGTNEEENNGMFVRIQSWDENKQHEEFKKFEGRKIRITIETID